MGARGALGVMAPDIKPDESGEDDFLSIFESSALGHIIQLQAHASRSLRRQYTRRAAFSDLTKGASTNVCRQAALTGTIAYKLGSGVEFPLLKAFKNVKGSPLYWKGRKQG